MNYIHRTLLTIILLALSACGGGSEPTRIVFIGNSLTLVPASPEQDWPESKGMAASSPDKDYAHIVASHFRAELSASNFADLERHPAASTPRIREFTGSINSGTWVVIELGDNAAPGGSDEFTTAYRALLTAASAGAKLSCVSTWWQDDAKDAMIRSECEAQGGKFVYIGDIYPTRLDTGTFSHPGINNHPHDWSMNEIAIRVIKSLQ
jgi:hypothetical protein